MVNGISSLQPKACTFVFCQFTSNPRDAASLAIVSNMGTRSSSSSARERHRQQNPGQWRSFGQTPHQSSKIQQSCPATNPCLCKWVWGQHTALANTSLDFKPWAVSPTCPNTTNRVVVQHSKRVSQSYSGYQALSGVAIVQNTVKLEQQHCGQILNDTAKFCPKKIFERLNYWNLNLDDNRSWFSSLNYLLHLRVRNSCYKHRDDSYKLS